jgi:endonuclease/exonuclease/phosphatase family metal-dependent hydrolase
VDGQTFAWKGVGKVSGLVWELTDEHGNGVLQRYPWQAYENHDFDMMNGSYGPRVAAQDTRASEPPT